MNGAEINAKVWAGYAKAANVIGTTYHHFRPLNALAPLANQLPDMLVSLNADDPRYSRPNVYGKSTWYAVADGSQLLVGDYITGIEGTFFVAALQQMLPIFMVDCNRILTVKRPQQQSGVGALPYGGDTEALETTLMQSFPGSMLKGGGHTKADEILPGDIKAAGFQVLLPHFAGVTIRPADVIEDDLGERLIVSLAELTDLGWRIEAVQVTS